MGKMAVWDAQKHRFIQKEVKGSPNPGNGGHTVWYGVTGDQLKTLTGFAKEDSFDLNSDTEIGRKAKVGKAVKQYMGIAIESLIAMRLEASKEPVAATKEPVPAKR